MCFEQSIKQYQLGDMCCSALLMLPCPLDFSLLVFALHSARCGSTHVRRNFTGGKAQVFLCQSPYSCVNGRLLEHGHISVVQKFIQVKKVCVKWNEN